MRKLIMKFILYTVDVNNKETHPKLVIFALNKAREFICFVLYTNRWQRKRRDKKFREALKKSFNQNR